MSLVLELPAETEAQLRQTAARAGLDVEQWIIEVVRKESAQINVISLDEAARRLSVARAFARESFARGELSGEWRGDELFIFTDERFEALRQQQAETQDGLIEIARINSTLGLYD